MGKEYDLETITKTFGRYQWFQLVVIWWCQISTCCNIVFMVYGGATNEHCMNQTENSTICDYDFYSFVPQWNLMNGYQSVTTVMTAVQLTGALLGSLACGHIADRYGRKFNTWLCLCVTMVLVFLSAFSPNWQMMIAFRFFIGVFSGGYESSAAILMMEWVNPKTRLKVQISLDCVNSVAFCWFAFLAWLCHDWKTLLLVCSLQILPCALAFLFIMETPRWCCVHKKSTVLENNLRKLEKWNQQPYCFDYSYFVLNSTLAATLATGKESTYLDLFKSKKLITNTFMLVLTFFVTGSVGYMIIFNVGNLIGNIFLNFALLGAVNIVAALLTVLLQHIFHFGRRMLHQICLNGVWICLTVIIVLHATHANITHSYIVITFALLGSMFSFPLWTVSNLYSGELFPTNVRNMANGIGNTAARAGGILAPIILYLMHVWAPLPFLVIVFVCLWNVLLACIYLPETENCALPEYGLSPVHNNPPEMSEKF